MMLKRGILIGSGIPVPAMEGTDVRSAPGPQVDPGVKYYSYGPYPGSLARLKYRTYLNVAVDPNNAAALEAKCLEFANLAQANDYDTEKIMFPFWVTASPGTTIISVIQDLLAGWHVGFAYNRQGEGFLVAPINPKQFELNSHGHSDGSSMWMQSNFWFAPGTVTWAGIYVTWQKSNPDRLDITYQKG